MVAHDIISVFHVCSCIAFFLKTNGDTLTIWLKRDMNGNFALREGTFYFEGKKIEILHKCENGNFNLKLVAFLKFFALIAVKPLTFFINKKVYLLHHTYFKPTGLEYVRFTDLWSTCLVSFEEGVGSYGSIYHDIKVSRREGKKFPRMKFFVKRLLKLFVSDSFVVLDSKNLQGNGYYFREAISIISDVYFKEVIQAYSNKEKLAGNVLILPSPSFIRGKAHGIIKEIAEDSHKICYVKPHPLDKSLSHFNNIPAIFINSNVPAESIFGTLNPEVVLGDISTSVLVAKNVYNLKVYLMDNTDIDFGIKKLFSDIEVYK